MKALKSAVAASLGEERYARLRHRFWDEIEGVGYLLRSEGRASAARIRSFRNAYAGQRCFIIGNGPSLREMDLSPLQNEFTFGLNRIYILFERLGFNTSFLVSVNNMLLRQCVDELASLHMPKFFSWRVRDVFPTTDDLIFVRPVRRPRRRFTRHPTLRGIWEGSTVTYVAMQLAYYMGFKKVILIGVDHSYTTKGPAHQLVTSSSDDPNHFDPKYFGKGFKWNLPDLDTSEIAYRIAKDQFEHDGRTVVDATVGGKLQIFPKVSYSSLF